MLQGSVRLKDLAWKALLSDLRPNARPLRARTTEPVWQCYCSKYAVSHHYGRQAIVFDLVKPFAMALPNDQAQRTQAERKSDMMPPADQNALPDPSSIAALPSQKQAKTSVGADFRTRRSHLHPEKLLRVYRQREMAECLNSLYGGSERPWKAYPSHRQLIRLDMKSNRHWKAAEYQPATLNNNDAKDWFKWRLQ